MLVIGPTFEFSNFDIWKTDLSFRSMDFGFEFVFLDLGFYDLDLRFAKSDVGYCP